MTYAQRLSRWNSLRIWYTVDMSRNILNYKGSAMRLNKKPMEDVPILEIPIPTF